MQLIVYFNCIRLFFRLTNTNFVEDITWPSLRAHSTATNTQVAAARAAWDGTYGHGYCFGAAKTDFEEEC